MEQRLPGEIATYTTRALSHETVDKKVRYMQIIEILKDKELTAKEIAVAMYNKGYSYTAERNISAPRLTELSYKGIVEPVGKTQCRYTGKTVAIYKLKMKWDMILAFPPCTYLTSAGTRHYSLKCNSKEKIEDRIKKRNEAAEFFMKFANADCPKIAIENPVGYMNTHYKKPSQIIHPYYFAKDYNDVENYQQKRTCLWLKGLPKLNRKTNLDKPKPIKFLSNGKPVYFSDNHGKIGNKKNGKSDAEARSKTFPGIAEAMASQWTRVSNTNTNERSELN